MPRIFFPHSFPLVVQLFVNVCKMDILKAEIASKRKFLEEKHLVDEKKKYFQRGELLAKNTEEILQKVGYKTWESKESDQGIQDGSNQFFSDNQSIIGLLLSVD
uniref:Uncharacterized protein n=1 Tax=Glossina austeni TaxID=7395 RepID=A0A1A9UDC6_GLOAU